MRDALAEEGEINVRFMRRACNSQLNFRKVNRNSCDRVERASGEHRSAPGARSSGYVTVTWISFPRRRGAARRGGCDVRSRALSHLRTGALPAIKKRSFLCRHPLSLSLSLSPGPFASPLVPSIPSVHRAFSSFPRFFFSPCLLLLSPSRSPLPSHAPFFPGTSLSTRLTPLLVAYLESSITCT